MICFAPYVIASGSLLLNDTLFKINKYGTCNGNYKLVHVKSRKGTLESCKVNLSYMKGTINYSLKFKKANFKLHKYIDVDRREDLDTQGSVIGYIHTFGVISIS